MSDPHPLSGLKPIRHYRGLSLADAADLIGVTASSYARFEAGTRRIYLDKAATLADALGCTVDDLRRYRSEDELFHHLQPWKRPSSVPVPPPPAAPVAQPDHGLGTVVGALADWDEASAS